MVAEDPSASGNAKSSAPMLKVSNDAWLDKTWQEIYDAFPNVYLENEELSVKQIITNMQAIFGTTYAVCISNGEAVDTFVADSADGYPKL